MCYRILVLLGTSLLGTVGQLENGLIGVWLMSCGRTSLQMRYYRILSIADQIIARSSCLLIRNQHRSSSKHCFFGSKHAGLRRRDLAKWFKGPGRPRATLTMGIVWQ